MVVQQTAMANGLHGPAVLAASCITWPALFFAYPLSKGIARHQG